MANSLTYQAEEYMLKEAASAGGIAAMATHIRLCTTRPIKDGTLAVEATGGAYAAKVIVTGNWTYSAVNGRIMLADQVWTAVGTPIPNINGAYITDVGGNVLAWWERAAFTLAAGESLTLDDLTVTLS